ncbi:hypothetical protein RI065_01490 [Mycoplasmatota bacterium zrk1]
MKRIKLVNALKLVASSIILISIVYIWIGFTKDMWSSTWYLYGFPVFLWWLLDLFFNYTRGPLFYRGLIPFITLLYVGVAYFTSNWIDTLIIVSFIPFLVLVYNAKFYRFKYSVIPISASIIIIIYLYIGLFLDLWHPHWVIFLLVPVIALLQNYE